MLFDCTTLETLYINIFIKSQTEDLCFYNLIVFSFLLPYENLVF